MVQDSGNTPILYELDSIFNHTVKNHVILVDDARCFTGQDDYPLIDDLRRIISEKSDYEIIKIENDIIIIENPTCPPNIKDEIG